MELLSGNLSEHLIFQNHVCVTVCISVEWVYRSKSSNFSFFIYEVLYFFRRWRCHQNIISWKSVQSTYFCRPTTTVVPTKKVNNDSCYNFLKCLIAKECTAMSRQRITANGFNAIWFILLKERNNNQNQEPVVTFTKFNLIRRLFTLFAPILLHHVQLNWSSSSFPVLSRPLLGIDSLSFPLSGGPGPPSPPSPCWPYLLQTPGNCPLPCRAQYLLNNFVCSYKLRNIFLW